MRLPRGNPSRAAPPSSNSRKANTLLVKSWGPPSGCTSGGRPAGKYLPYSVLSTVYRMLRLEDRGPVRWLTLDRPERHNAIPPEGWEVREALAEFEASSQRVLVVTGAGGAFCSGADVAADGASGGLGSHRARYERMQKVGAAARALHRLTKPTVAAVDGVAAGAGMNLALGCDLVIASTRARFAEIFVQRGLTVDFGGTWLLPRIVGLQRAKELALTGRIVEAAEACRIGMVLEVVEPEELECGFRSWPSSSPPAPRWRRPSSTVGLDRPRR